MIIRSFRARFMLWNVLLSGAVLAVFGALAWLLSYRVGLARLDGDIREHARRELNEARRPGYRERLQHPWRSEYGGGPDRVAVALLIRRRGDADVLLRTAAWPADLMDSAFVDPPAPPDPDPLLADERAERPPAPFERRSPPRDEVDRPFPGPRDDRPPLPNPPLQASAGAFVSLRRADCDWRFGVVGTRELTALVGVPLQPLQEDLRELARVFLAAFLPGLLLIAGSGWILTSRALRPVVMLTRTAEGITARGLDQRLPVTRGAEEFNRLAEVFNGMLDRLEKSFQQATRFSADAAHELKTPLTILQGQLEESLREAGDDPAHQRLCAGLLEELQVGGAVAIPADPDPMAQVVQNLVSNAIKYNREDGFIRLELAQTPEGIRLAVTNSGPPILAATTRWPTCARWPAPTGWRWRRRPGTQIHA
jgi:HAMP domain-containing protein